MRKLILAAVLAAVAAPIATPALADPPPWSHAGGRHEGWGDRDGDRDDWRGPPPGRWDHGPDRYREYRLSRYDRVWRGRDGRYYCRRSDGTTGLIVGGVLGGLVGNSLADHRDRTLGTLLGVAGGAALGQAIDRGNVRCR